MNGSIRERYLKKGVNKQGKTVNNLRVWDVFYRYSDPSTGRPKQTSKKGFRTKGEAEAFLLEVNSMIAGNNFILVQKLTVREYFLDWLKNYVETHLRRTTVAGYRTNIEKHVIPHLGSIELRALTASHLDSFYNMKLKKGRLDGKAGLAPKSVLYIHRVVSEALNHAEKKKLISSNPAKNVTSLPRVKKYKARILETSEIKSLLEAVKDTDMEFPIALASIGGCRRGEVLGLRKEDVSFERQTIKICRQLIPTKDGLIFEDPKTEDGFRIITPPQEIFEILRKHLERQEEYKRQFGDEYYDHGLINCYPNGNPIDPRNFSKQFSYLLKKNGLKPCRFHDLRHSCATLMLNSGVPMKVASEILGHSSIGITADLYSHVIADAKKDAAKKVGSEVFGDKP